MDWLRWYNGTATDPKWRVIAKRAGVPLHMVLAVWPFVLENANEGRERGVLDHFDCEDVAAALDLAPAQVAAILEAMQGKVLDGDRLSGWEKRNPKREREDSSTERVRRYREKQHRVTPCNASETPCNAEKHLEESRGEERTTSPSTDVEGAERGAGTLDETKAAILAKYQLTLAQLRAYQGEAAQIIRSAWWLGKKPPATAPRAGWSMAAEIAIWAELCLHYPPEQVNGGLRRARDALAGELRTGGLTLAVLRQDGQRDLLARAVAFWQREEAKNVATNNLGILNGYHGT